MTQTPLMLFNLISNNYKQCLVVVSDIYFLQISYVNFCYILQALKDIEVSI